MNLRVCLLRVACCGLWEQVLNHQDAYNANTTTLVKFITESGADTVVFDIQDVGARFYTCTWRSLDRISESCSCQGRSGLTPLTPP
jgi:hypothetical protein